MAKLSEILEKFNNRKSYKILDDRALDISRKASAGDWGESDYADWALISNDPIVMINLVKTFITVLVSKLSANPFRPEDEQLTEVGIRLKLNNLFTKMYNDVLADGYSYLSIGMEHGRPVVVPVDARFVTFIGDDPTLADCQDLMVFEITGKRLDDDDVSDEISQLDLDSYIKYNHETEQVSVKYYYIRKKDDMVCLDIYKGKDELDEKNNHYELTGLSRIPIIRFVGDDIELSDQRTHYRGLYHHTAAVLKAMVLAATKINIMTASADDDNYIAQIDAIQNHLPHWQNAGIKTFDGLDANGQPLQIPTPIQHDTQFLVSAFQTWKGVLSDMLGPVVSSGSEAVTREEVLARNEVRDALTNSYLSKMVDSIAQTYKVISEMTNLAPQETPIILGGFIEAVKRNQQKQELMQIYNLAKESGLNTQGFAMEMVGLADLTQPIKQRLAETFQKDPYKSPLTQQLQNQIQKLSTDIQARDQQIAVLRTQASQRLERQAEYVAMVERTRRMDIAFKQWQQESKDAQQGRLEMMKALLAQGDLAGALKALDAMEARDSLLLTQRNVDNAIAEGDALFKASVMHAQNITQQENVKQAAEINQADIPQPETTKQWG